MSALGMVTLGAFIGWVIAFGLDRMPKGTNPVVIFGSATSAAVAGVVLVFIQYAAPGSAGIFFYPVGLAYGALCYTLSTYIATTTPPNSNILLGKIVLAIASLAIVAIWIVSMIENWIPKTPVS